MVMKLPMGQLPLAFAKMQIRADGQLLGVITSAISGAIIQRPIARQHEQRSKVIIPPDPFDASLTARKAFPQAAIAGNRIVSGSDWIDDWFRSPDIVKPDSASSH